VRRFCEAAGAICVLDAGLTTNEEAPTMELRDKFDRRVDERAVAEILHSIGTAPNRREKPLLGDVLGDFDFWFDGGAGKVETGYVEYQFTNGARATVGAPVPALSVEINFANGCRVRVQQETWGQLGG